VPFVLLQRLLGIALLSSAALLTQDASLNEQRRHALLAARSPQQPLAASVD